MFQDLGMTYGPLSTVIFLLGVTTPILVLLLVVYLALKARDRRLRKARTVGASSRGRRPAQDRSRKGPALVHALVVVLVGLLAAVLFRTLLGSAFLEDGRTSPRRVGNEATAAQTLSVLEAVLKFEFDRVREGQHGFTPALICVQIRTSRTAKPTDAPAALLDRFSSHVPPVRVGSRCAYREDQVVELESGRPSIVFDIGPVELVGAEAATAIGGSYTCCRHANEYVYKVLKKAGWWVVVEARLEMLT